MPFAENLVTAASAELRFWKDNSLVECVPQGTEAELAGSRRVKTYWEEGVGVQGLDGCNRDQAWSAAFVCFCQRKAGMPLSEFPFSVAHHTYIRWAISNTKNNKQGKTYYARRIDSYQPKVGDLIAQWRKRRTSDPDPNISFDAQPDDFYASHCDIVVETSDTSILAIGGNVSQRVKTTKFSAENGILLPKRQLICILECTKI